MNERSPSSQPLTALFGSFRRGELSRRSFLHQAVTAGMALPVALHAINSVVAQTPVASEPAVGMEGRSRGQGSELRLLQWQAPTILAQHSALGGKDNLAATFILEPLTHYLADGTLIPNLVEQVPTVENGLLAADSSSVTYTLKSGVTWSDGTPFTAEDVRFTWSWITDPANGATSSDIYSAITNAEVIDELTIRLDFGGPQPAWYIPFSGSWWGAVYPRHILEGTDDDRYAQFLLNPTGTGPYRLEAFSPGDQVVYVANEAYRDPARPFFSRILLKGGGDAASAAARSASSHASSAATSARCWKAPGTKPKAWLQPGGGGCCYMVRVFEKANEEASRIEEAWRPWTGLAPTLPTSGMPSTP